MPLVLDPNFRSAGGVPARPHEPGDEFYELLTAAHQELSDEASARLTLRLMLILANHVGDLRVLREAISAARSTL